MKLLKTFGVLPIIMAMAACASGGKAGGTAVPADDQVNIVPASRNDIAEIDWYLLEVRNGNNIIKLNRNQLASEGNGDIYRLRFDKKSNVTGKAAPNNYHGPCKWGSSYDLSFGAMASTMMFAIKEPSALKEHDYFTYLTKVYSWALTSEGWLELFLSDESGWAVMIFERRS